jgi:nicotinamide riboside kinase
MKVWAEYVFGICPTFILDEINKQHNDLYLLCKPDIPWVKDELREYPNEKPRQELFQIYKDILINQQTPWLEISGDFETRNQTAVAAIDAALGY